MVESNPVYLTPDGIKKLQEELDYLVNVRRPEIANLIAEAKADGDVAENAGYDEAKNIQSFVEGRILTIRNLLANAVVISESEVGDIVELGCTVTIRDMQSGSEETYTIVGSAEVDPANGRISLHSPIGQALMGHRKGERIQVNTPGGVVELEIIRIS